MNSDWLYKISNQMLGYFGIYEIVMNWTNNDGIEWLMNTGSEYVYTPPGWLSGEQVRLMTWWLRVRSPVEANFFPAYFWLSPLQNQVRKVVGGFEKKSCVTTGVRKPGNTSASPTTMIPPLKWR